MASDRYERMRTSTEREEASSDASAMFDTHDHLLAVEAPGVWVVCELKKIALERESLAQGR